MKRTHLAASLASLVIATSLVPNAARASETDPTFDALAQASAAADTRAERVLGDQATQVVQDDRGLTAEVRSDTTSTVPRDPSKGITLDADLDVTVGLPFASEASDARGIGRATVAYDNHNSTETAVVVKTDGSVQVATVIESADAPTEFVYPLTVPTGGSIALEGGFGWIKDASGRFVAGIAPSWAKAADGQTVPSRYELEGTNLIQIVEHSADMSYPVVADPWVGMDLFSKITVDSYNRQPRVNLDLSPWGWAVWSGAA